ncbi:hypothetical protein DMN91_012408 [Ooceraea biroi]|uniref:Uncharacterized protein n=1 Tax=Ooceraea biroi TaxID=2015173 RepID=A0A026VV20_OOCBI|nr:uncharacterized protein LOC105286221 [Ooceraea biroi]EZA47608.1 hypothetical protein X777_15356 [Ooceraea biroi]RLU15414.1 hypothetical protein DMN91_012408 [Ooceraea biroi]
MIRLYSCIILFSLGVFAQENAYLRVSSTLQECYENGYLLEKDNRLPHTLNTLIAIIEKIENVESLNLDARSLAVSIMHRFRQDGIVKIPSVPKKSRVLPYMVDEQGEKYLQILRFIPENSPVLPYDVITDIERCTLHFMLSSSIEMYERGDEGTECRHTDNAYRNARSVSSNHSGNSESDIHDDVETLTPEQIDVITNHKNGVTEDAIDPNALYPELPPNHPEIARVLARPPTSRCPVENGVVKTNWGPVSAGPVIAGIAAGLQPETVKISTVLRNESPEKRSNISDISLDNRWIATVAGDLAEVALLQGPMYETVSVGVNGNWNSSFLPRWYFLKTNEKLEFTTAEIRGDLDGLILANEIDSLYQKIPTLRLSQILDMYYSAHGLFNSSIRACNRGTTFKEVVPRSMMIEQAYAASLVVKEYYRTATMHDDVIEAFATQAVDELSTYVSSSMSKDLSCQDTDTGHFNDVIQTAVDLTIILDTSWTFDLIQPILANILDKLKVNRFTSQYTIINGHDGSIMMNTTSNILNFGHYNITNYRNVSAGFDFAKSLDKLLNMQREKLNYERSTLGNAKSDVILVIPHATTISDSDHAYCMDQLKKMREQVPDAKLLILSYGQTDRWASFVTDSTTDLFSTSTSDVQGTISNLISRIRQVPQRLINTQCGADYSVVGDRPNSFFDYVQPSTTVLYRLHPNYFFSRDSGYTATIKIEGSGWGDLKVCTTRQLMNIKEIADASISCTSINSNTHTISFSCGEAEYIHLCPPMYLSITANSSIRNFQCTDTKACRFPHMIKYTVSYDNLVCVSSASISMLNAIVLIISMIYILL